MQKFSLISKLFIASIVTTGAVALVNTLVHWKTSQPVELFALLAMTVIASRLKVKLPGINGTMSVNVPFLLIVAGATGFLTRRMRTRRVQLASTAATQPGPGKPPRSQ